MRRRLPSTTSLICFEAAARAENFTQAAAQLNMTQSALSRQIKQLEYLLNQSLFKRIKQRVVLSAAGQRLLAELSPQLDQLEVALLGIQDYDRLSGSLNVGVYPTLGSRWLMPKLMLLGENDTDLTINTLTYLHNGQIDASTLDIAIVQGDPPWPGFQADFLMSETMVAVYGKNLMDGPYQDARDLLKQRILQHVTRPQSWEIWFNHLGQPLPAKPLGPTYHQFEMLIEAVVSGHGIALLPEVLIQRELQQGTLLLAHPKKVTSKSAYYLLTPMPKIDTPKIRHFRSWLLDIAHQDKSLSL